MELITSKTNAVVERALKLKQKKYREKFNQVLLEGEKIIREAVESGHQLDTVFVQTGQFFDFLSSIRARIVEASPAIIKMLGFTVTSQGIIAVANIKENKNYDIQGNALVVDNLQNPDNLGAIIRTAAAANFNNILAVNCVDIYNEKTIRASMGNLFKINYIETTYEEISSLLKGHEILIASMEGENIFEQKDIKNPVALVIGNEGRGVSEEMKKLSVRTVSIPMQNGVESLNAGVSAGIIMYQLNSIQSDKSGH